MNERLANRLQEILWNLPDDTSLDDIRVLNLVDVLKGKQGTEISRKIKEEFTVPEYIVLNRLISNAKKANLKTIGQVRNIPEKHLALHSGFRLSSAKTFRRIFQNPENQT